jgi:hypothetical protein
MNKTFSNDKMNNFVDKMIDEINEHNNVYGNTWSDHATEFLEQRMTAKHTEFKLTHNPKKLVSLANLIMLLYIRLRDENND